MNRIFLCLALFALFSAGCVELYPTPTKASDCTVASNTLAKDMCYNKVAIYLSKDASKTSSQISNICRLVSSDDGENLCFYNSAIYRQALSVTSSSANDDAVALCSNIGVSSIEADCIIQIAIASGNKDYCNRIPAPESSVFHFLKVFNPFLAEPLFRDQAEMNELINYKKQCEFYFTG